MIKKKHISAANLPLTIPFTHLIALWFLWDKFPLEWFRTLLVLWGIFVITAFIFSLFTTDYVDIFKEEKA